MFWTPEKHYLNDPFEAEAELESAIAEVSAAKRAEGGTGIPACASAPSQTRMSVAQWERCIGCTG